MFAQSLPSQQGSLFSVECTTQNDNTDGDNSTGSWETTYSADEALLMAPVDLVTKGAGADIGSPMSHLYAFERASSAPIQADTLNRMASITLDDSHAFLPASRNAVLSAQGPNIFISELDLNCISCYFPARSWEHP